VEVNLILIVLAGLLAGTIHVLSGPDHLAAIAPFAAHQPKKSWMIGMWWGMGHTLSVWAIAILVFFMKGFLPLSGLSQWGERMIGMILIALGVWGIQKALRSKVHYHLHEHDGMAHAHFHVHDKRTAHHHESRPHKHKHVPMSIGVIHGFGGSTHLIAVIPAIAIPGRYNAAGYVVGFGIGTIIAMICFSWLIGMIQQKVIHRFSNGYRTMQLSFSFIAIGVGIFWIINNI